MGKIHTTFNLPPLTTIMIFAAPRHVVRHMPRSGCQPKPPRKVGVPSVTGQVGSQVQNDGKDGNPSTGPVFSPQKKTGNQDLSRP